MFNKQINIYLKNEIKIINYNAIYREIGTEKKGHVVLGEAENFQMYRSQRYDESEH